jgi:NAD(P)-dependent dehydrogenase (short-subunit alcohol dehydrogenase family)
MSRPKERRVQAAAAVVREWRAVALPADLSAKARSNDLPRVASEPAACAVNNAAAAWAAPLETYPSEAWDKVLALNVKGPFLLSRACLPLLKAGARPGDPARIINIGSIDGFRVTEFETYAYTASKAAVHHLTRVLAQRMGRDNVTVNAIAPGPFPTRMTAAMLDEQGEALRRKSPLGRVGEPDDMAGIAVFLASRASAFVTGQIIAVDGGMSTRPW